MSNKNTGNSTTVHSKKDKFPKERIELLNKLYNILGIDEKNRVFYLDELEANEEKQEQIIALVPDVKKYFACAMWSYFAKPQLKDKRYLSLTKSILKDMEVKTVAVNVRKGRQVLKSGIQFL